MKILLDSCVWGKARADLESGAIVTAEEHLQQGGLGSLVAQVVVKHRPVPMEFVALNGYAQSGKPAELMVRYGLTAADIVMAVKNVLQRKS